MKTEIEILKAGDEILSKLKEQPNNICTQLNKNEEISFNTGFHRGFVSGYTEAVENCNILAVNNRREQLIAYQLWCYQHPEYDQICQSSKVDIYLKAINCC